MKQASNLFLFVICLSLTSGIAQANTLNTCGLGAGSVATPWNFQDGNVWRNGGNVGIGTDEPSTTLHVVGGVTLENIVGCTSLGTNGDGLVECSASIAGDITSVTVGAGLTGGALSGDVSLGIDWSAVTTANLNEGGSNLYYTQARFDTAFAAKSSDDVSEGGSNLYYTDARFGTSLASRTSDNVSEGSSNLYFTAARFNSELGAKTSDDVAEGSSNLYFSPERLDDRVSDLFANSLSLSWTYNDAGDSFTGEVVTSALLGTNNQVVVSNGANAIVGSTDVTLSLPQDIHTEANPSFGDLSLTGALSAAGSADSSIAGSLGVGTDSPETKLHVGVDGSGAHTNVLTLDRRSASPANGNSLGLSFRHENDADELSEIANITAVSSSVTDGSEGGRLSFALANGSTGALSSVMTLYPTGNVSIGSSSEDERLMVDGRVKLEATTAPVDTSGKLYNVAGKLFWDGAELSAASAGIDSIIAGAGLSGGGNSGDVTLTLDLSSSSTDDLSEGSSNQYYSQARFDTSLATKDTDDVAEGDTNLYYTQARFDTALGAKTTDNLTEGSTNLYFTSARLDTALAAKDTDSLSEGSSNFYYTQARFDTSLGTKDTDDVAEGDTNLYYTQARFDTALGAKTTDNLTEGSTNLYFTSARLDTALAAKDTDSLSEGSSNFYYTQARFDTSLGTKDTDDVAEGDTNLYYTQARFDTALGAKTTDNLTEGSTNLYFTSARLDTALAAKDTDSLSEGSSNFYYTQARFDTSFGTKDTDDVAEGDTNLYYTQARFDTALGAKTTDNLTEGSTNLYFTSARLDTALAAKDTDSLSEGSSNFYYTQARFDTSLGTKDTDDVAEGSTNFYYTQARFDAALGAKNSDNLSEGSSNFYFTNGRFDTALATKDSDDISEGSSNLYFNNERVDDRIAALLQNTDDLSWTYNDVANTLTPNLTSSDLNGTSNQITVTGGTDTLLGSGDVTISLPQDIHSGASPDFLDLDLSGRLKVAGVADSSFAGKLGVGLLNPEALLHVQADDATAEVDLLVLDRLSDSPANNDSYNILFRHENNNDERVPIGKMKMIAKNIVDGTEEGSFGISLANGVNGSVDQVLDLTAGGDLSIDGTLEVSGVASIGITPICISGGNKIGLCISSRRYKKNIEEYAPGLDTVEKLRPVTFDWKTHERKDLGLIAEEVAEAEPLLARFDDEGKADGVFYDRVGIVLINAIKELHAENKALRVAHQESQSETANELASLREELRRLKEGMNND